MVGWSIKFTKKAAKDAGRLKEAHLDERAKNLLSIMREDPFRNPPSLEKLRRDLSGKYSRRINLQHRLVYGIDTEHRIVTVYAMYSHYGD